MISLFWSPESTMLKHINEKKIIVTRFFEILILKKIQYELYIIKKFFLKFLKN